MPLILFEIHMRRRPLAHREPTRGRPQRGWDHVAPWYTDHLREEHSLLRTVVYPNALRLLGPMRGKHVLDIACGEGTFAEMLSRAGAQVVGVDASAALIRTAERKRIPHAEFRVGDARELRALRTARDVREPPFDAATCLLAIASIDPIEPVLQGITSLLSPGAPFVVVLAHPCFRIPRQTGWGWDEERKLQYRRVDRYLTSMRIPVQARPGAAPNLVTTTYHRPLSTYVGALAAAGFVVSALEEWTSDRASDSGPRAKAENRIRAEIPVFLAIRATHA